MCSEFAGAVLLPGFYGWMGLLVGFCIQAGWLGGLAVQAVLLAMSELVAQPFHCQVEPLSLQSTLG